MSAAAVAALTAPPRPRTHAVADAVTVAWRNVLTVRRNPQPATAASSDPPGTTRCPAPRASQPAGAARERPDPTATR